MAVPVGAGPDLGRPGPRDRRTTLALRELVAAFSHLSALASQDADVDGVVGLVARRTHCPVAVVGPGQAGDLDVLCAEPPDAAERFAAAVGPDRLTTVLAAAARNQRAVALSGLPLTGGTAAARAASGGAGPAAALGTDRAVVVPVLVGHDVAAHLVTLAAGEPELGEDLHLLLAEHAATVCGVILSRERVVAAAAGRARTDLVEGLLLARDRDGEEADRWAEHLGFSRGTQHHVLAVRASDTPQRAGALATVERTLTRGRSAAIVALREHDVVAVVPAPDGGGPALDAVRALAERCCAAVRHRHPGADATAGIGGGCQQAGEIARSYTEARACIDAARRMPHTPSVVAYEELGVLRLLLQVPDLDVLRAFAADVLGGVLGEGRGADLVGTLAAWFRCSGSPQRTARELHVHPNTVSYRIRRVEEIAGLRLDHHRDRLMAQLACEIVQVLT